MATDPKEDTKDISAPGEPGQARNSGGLEGCTHAFDAENARLEGEEDACDDGTR